MKNHREKMEREHRAEGGNITSKDARSGPDIIGGGGGDQKLYKYKLSKKAESRE